jgi:hypothetical protein
MYSIFHENNLRARDGYIYVVPVSATYGNGDRWELTAATIWEKWKNTDFDVEEDGIGDLFVSVKARVLCQEKEKPLDLSLMPYILLPTGDREKSIGDLYLYNPTDDDDESIGIYLLLGKRWRQVYVAANVGFNYMDSDLDYIESSSVFLGLTMEYQISECLTSYVEFFNNENKNQFQYPFGHPYYDGDADKDMREIGLGIGWLFGRFGLKVHAGAGLTETSPDFRLVTLVNVSFP